MWVKALGLIFDKVLRSLELTDIMVIDAYPSEERVRIDCLTGSLNQVGHVNRVCVGARGFPSQPFEERTVHIC